MRLPACTNDLQTQLPGCSGKAGHLCRVEYLQRTLMSLAHLEGLHRFAVYVSQDGHHDGVALLADRLGRKHFKRRARHFEHWQRDRVPQLGSEQARNQARLVSP